jgi:hypothetical protein
VSRYEALSVLPLLLGQRKSYLGGASENTVQRIVFSPRLSRNADKAQKKPASNIVCTVTAVDSKITAISTHNA